jgi:hypothetical protein
MTSPALQRYVIAWAEREVAIASVKRAEKDMFNEQPAVRYLDPQKGWVMIDSMKKAIAGMDWGILIAAPLLTFAAVVMAAGALVFYAVLKPVELVLLWEARR